MPTWVHDPLTDRWIVRAAGRSARPQTHGAPITGCPFCPGNEQATPPEVARVDDGAGGWLVRVFPNLYPAVQAGNGPGADGHPQAGRAVLGSHEVVVTTPDHNASFADFTEEQATAAVATLLERAQAHLDAGATSSQAFINHGPAAGASVEHPHGQVVSLDVVPPVAIAEAQATRPGTCAICVEVDDPAHQVFGRGGLRVLAPSASWLRGELLVVPAAHGRFEPHELGPTLRDALSRLRDAEGDVPYNVVLHPRSPQAPRGHDHAHIVPRTATIGGFELGTGLYLSAADPVATAADLRQAPPPSSSKVSDAELMQ